MAHDGEIYISQATYDAVSSLVETERIGDLLVKGRSVAVHTYRVVRKKETTEVAQT